MADARRRCADPGRCIDGRFAWLVLLIALTLAPGVVQAQDAAATPEAEGEVTEELSLWERAQAFYEDAVAAGVEVPSDVAEWFREDTDKIGTWQYRVVLVELDRLEETLNELGQERWECILIESQGHRRRLVLKRPTRTYLGAVRWLDLIKLISVGSALGLDGS